GVSCARYPAPPEQTAHVDANYVHLRSRAGPRPRQRDPATRQRPEATPTLERAPARHPIRRRTPAGRAHIFPRALAEEPARALARELGASPPAGLALLSEAELRSLAEAVGGARRRQAAELEAAGERALGHLPRLLRVAVRKVL